MSRRVQFDHYGSADVLRVVDVPRPSADDGQVPVRVVAAGINPGEIAIRNGAMEQMFPATFPSGQGSDFAGRVVEVGSGVTEFAPGDEVLGWSDRRFGTPTPNSPAVMCTAKSSSPPKWRPTPTPAQLTNQSFS
jgi:NADPH:quinone reductase-like Zn-dependent oxidoreductase